MEDFLAGLPIGTALGYQADPSREKGRQEESLHAHATLHTGQVGLARAVLHVKR